MTTKQSNTTALTDQELEPVVSFCYVVIILAPWLVFAVLMTT